MTIYLFSFMKLCSKSPACNWIPQLRLYLQSFLIAVAIIIATYGQKTLHWKLRKVILSCMYNCNFQAINQVLNKRMRKLEMEHESFTCIIIFYVAVSIRFRKEFPFQLSQFAGTTMISIINTAIDLSCSRLFLILYTKFCLDHLFYETSTFVCFSAI